jgi:hypothetical protein
MRGFLKFSHFVASKSTVSFEFCHEPHNLLPQNRCFARGFRQFSSHLTKCHVCPEIFTLTSPDAALTMRSVKKNAQYNTSEVLRLPREMTMEVSKVMHLPRRMQLILGKRRKNVAPATQNDFGHIMKHVGMSRSPTPAYATFAASKIDHFCRTRHWHGHFALTTVARGHLRTVADGCARLHPDLQSKMRTLRYSFGKNID